MVRVSLMILSAAKRTPMIRFRKGAAAVAGGHASAVVDEPAVAAGHISSSVSAPVYGIYSYFNKFF